MGQQEDEALVSIIALMEGANLKIQAIQKTPDNQLDKRALAIAVTHLETAMLWLANSRP
jgi:hypothetical protein